jgi:cell wall-associated NlpC family hydrolase
MTPSIENSSVDMDREMFVNAVINAGGLPYIYGSNGPDSFDCSGLIVACMRKRWPNYPDRTARDLYSHYEVCAVLPADIIPGCLLFYSNFGHVVVCIRKLSHGMLVISGANGGTPLCKTEEDAYHSHAMVEPAYARIENGIYSGWWKTAFCGAVDPFKNLTAIS